MTETVPILRLRRVNNQLECELMDPSSMQIISFEKPNKLTEKNKKEILRQYVNILRMTRSEGTTSIKRFKYELRELGKKIWKILGPIFEDFDLHINEGVSLALALDEDTVEIPWELALFKKRPSIHLCEYMDISRLRVVKDERWVNCPERRRKPRALVVGINYEGYREELGELECAEKEAQKIASILEDNDFKVTFLFGRNAKKSKIVKEIRRGVDIFHFTGHGSMYKDESKIMACDEDLFTKEIDSILRKTVAPRLSFINACETAVERDTISKRSWNAYSWAYALAKYGGRVFVGTLWPIFEDWTLFFSCIFYKELFKSKKRTLANAIRKARCRVKKKAKDRSIYTWPAYVLYGPPSLLIDDILRLKT